LARLGLSEGQLCRDHGIRDAKTRTLLLLLGSWLGGALGLGLLRHDVDKVCRGSVNESIDDREIAQRHCQFRDRVSRMDDVDQKVVVVGSSRSDTRNRKVIKLCGEGAGGRG
jgi:hypothetical protein